MIRALTALLALLVVSAAFADDLDDLIAAVKPPAQFAGHAPRFAIEESITLATYDIGKGPVDGASIWAVKDGERRVAMYQPDVDRVDLLPVGPDERGDVTIPVVYGDGAYFGTAITAGPVGVSCRKKSFRATTGDGFGALVARQDGLCKQQAVALYTFTFRHDSVLGYVATCECWIVSAKPLTDERGEPLREIELCSVMAQGMGNPWRQTPGGRWEGFERTTYCPEGVPAGQYAAWSSNWGAAAAASKAGLKLRNGGFAAFTIADLEEDDRRPWGTAISYSGAGPCTLGVGTAWQDLRFRVALADRPDADGVYRTHAVFRFVRFPMAVAKSIKERSTLLDFGGERAVMLRLNTTEDCEDQPLPLTTIDPAIPCNGLRVSTDHAHTGKQSLVADGVADRKYRGLPLQCPMPHVSGRYMLSGWIRVEGADTEASIVVDLYTRGAQGLKCLTPQETNVVKAGQGWTKVALEFFEPLQADGPYADFRLRVTGPGKAYFDDIRFIPANW